MDLKHFDESLQRHKEEHFFDKFKNVSNLLKELKHNSHSSGLIQTIGGLTSNSNSYPHFDEKSLKLQDLEKTASNINSSKQ